MRFKFIIIFLIISSCSANLTTINQKKPYNSAGFAYIYNEIDFKNKIVKGKMNNERMQISHQNLKTGTLIKIINPRNNKSLVLKNVKRIKYPDFYKILITKKVAEELNLNIDTPILEILEIKKNKSFIAEKAKIYNEEKKISSKAPVTLVEIANISKNKSIKKKNQVDEIFIHIATFYSIETANFLKKRIIKDVKSLEKSKLKIKKINNKETQVILGPYKTVNLLKNDYIKLKNFGFEDLDIFINE
tara:strand:+ start:32 stop:769 length:738 start_codon:yes stop_codon:yes gene_type:complete